MTPPHNYHLPLHAVHDGKAEITDHNGKRRTVALLPDPVYGKLYTEIYVCDYACKGVVVDGYDYFEFPV